MIPFRHILVPLDGSELAEKAIAPAALIAAACGRQEDPTDNQARLDLLRVVSPMALLAADPLLYDDMIRMSTDEAQSYLDKVSATIDAAPAIVETRTVSGSPADAIVQYIEENGVDLVVISSHGRTGSSRWVYGSVAEKVMHHAVCATAIIRAHVAVEMFQNRKILIPLDGSQLGERALNPALSLAENMGSDVFLLRITPGRGTLPESMTPAGGSGEQTLSAAEQQERAEAEKYLQQISTGQDYQRVFFDVQVTDGDVADAIVSYAEANQIDLIVLSSHGRSGIGRWLHGSVAEKVLRGANCATLIIRDQLS